MKKEIQKKISNGGMGFKHAKPIQNGIMRRSKQFGGSLVAAALTTILSTSLSAGVNSVLPKKIIEKSATEGKSNSFWVLDETNALKKTRIVNELNKLCSHEGCPDRIRGYEEQLKRLNLKNKGVKPKIVAQKPTQPSSPKLPKVKFSEQGKLQPYLKGNGRGVGFKKSLGNTVIYGEKGTNQHGHVGTGKKGKFHHLTNDNLPKGNPGKHTDIRGAAKKPVTPLKGSQKGWRSAIQKQLGDFTSKIKGAAKLGKKGQVNLGRATSVGGKVLGGILNVVGGAAVSGATASKMSGGDKKITKIAAVTGAITAPIAALASPVCGPAMPACAIIFPVVAATGSGVATTRVMEKFKSKKKISTKGKTKIYIIEHKPKRLPRKKRYRKSQKPAKSASKSGKFRTYVITNKPKPASPISVSGSSKKFKTYTINHKPKRSQVRKKSNNRRSKSRAKKRNRKNKKRYSNRNKRSRKSRTRSRRSSWPGSSSRSRSSSKGKFRTYIINH